MHQKAKDLFESFVHNGEWIGPRDEHGEPKFIVYGRPVDIKDTAKQLGIKFKNSDKYRKEHADLEQTFHSGHTEDSGDGISESEE